MNENEKYVDPQKEAKSEQLEEGLTAGKYAGRSIEDTSFMPLWRSHKIVAACSITAADVHSDQSATLAVLGGAIVKTKPGWGARFTPEPDSDDLGFFVVYADGYQSWSPSKTFKEGYTPLDDESATPSLTDAELRTKAQAYFEQHERVMHYRNASNSANSKGEAKRLFSELVVEMRKLKKLHAELEDYIPHAGMGTGGPGLFIG